MVEPQKPQPVTTYLRFLDGIRGLAALWVLLAHCMIWGGWYGIPLPDAKIAVDIFMLISGYLMFHTAEERAAIEHPCLQTAIRFFLRRFFRIAPLYYLCLLFVFVLGQYVQDGLTILQHANLKQWEGTQYFPIALDHSWNSLLLHLSFAFGLFPEYASSVGLPDWSVGLEMQFYLVFPLLWYLFRRLNPIFAALVIFGSWLVVGRVFDYPHYPEPSFLPLKLPIFLSGMLISSAVRSFQLKPLDAALQTVFAIWLASLNSGYLVVMGLVLLTLSSNAVYSESLVKLPKNALSALLSNRISKFLADTSYAVYLIHGFFIALLGGWLYKQPYVISQRPVVRTLVLTLMTIVFTYSLSWLMHNWIELRCIAVGRKILSRAYSRR